METVVLDILLKYLLCPIVAVVFSALSLFFAQRNGLLTKRVIIYLSVSTFGLSLFGTLGVLDVYFMPYAFFVVQFIFLLMGVLSRYLLLKWLSVLESSFGKLLLLLLPQVLLSWAFFSIWFNLTNSFQYGVYAGGVALTLLVGPFFMSAYQAYLQIPIEIYKMKKYRTDDNYAMPYQALGSDDLLVCEIELFRHPEDKKSMRIKAKAKSTMVVGDWFGLIVSDYNQQAVDRPIEINGAGQEYAWMFYYKPSFFKTRRYIDPDASFVDNCLGEKDLIVAKRVKKEIE